jgi:hypothetical protein
MAGQYSRRIKMSKQDYMPIAEELLSMAVYPRHRGRSDDAKVIRDALDEAYESGVEDSRDVPPEVKVLVEAVEKEGCGERFGSPKMACEGCIRWESCKALVAIRNLYNL